MKLTVERLEEWEACEEGVEWFKKQDESDGVTVIEKLISEDKLDWASWTICRIFNRKQYIQYAVFSAEQVIDLFEKKYPDDKRPRNAIEAAKKVLENDTPENRAAASAARDACDAWAAWAVWAAAWSAASAASDAASAAASAAASDAWDAAWSAASAAASDARDANDARKEMKTKILNYGLGLLK